MAPLACYRVIRFWMTVLPVCRNVGHFVGRHQTRSISMKILVIQHSAADGPAAATPVIEGPAHSVEFVRIDRGDPIPQSVDADALMMFGGAISLSGKDRPEWVGQEQSLIRDYVHEGNAFLESVSAIRSWLMPLAEKHSN